MWSDIVAGQGIYLLIVPIVAIWALASVVRRQIKARVQRAHLDTIRELAAKGMSADEIARALGPLHAPKEADDLHQELSELGEEMLERGWSATDVAATMKPLADLVAGATLDPSKAARFAALTPIVAEMLERKSSPHEVQKVVEEFVRKGPESSGARSFLPPRTDRPG